jgi:uncharacterized protein involved in exopolysaccharide biosynthesis
MAGVGSRPERSFFEVVRRRRWVVLVILVVGFAALIPVALHLKPKYGAMTHVLLINDSSGRDPITAGFDMPTLATSTSVVSAVRDQLHLTMSVADLQAGITAHVAPKSSIMTIAYRSKDPSLAIAVPNAVADEFITFYASIPSQRSAQVVNAFAAELKANRLQLSTIERQLEGASVGRTYVGSQSSLDNLAGELSLLRQQRGSAYSQLVQDRADLQSDKSQPTRMAKIVRAEILQNDRPYRELSTDVARDASSYTTTVAGVTDQFPGILGYRDKINKEKTALEKSRLAALNSPDAYSASEGGQIMAADKAKSAVDGDEAHVSAIDQQIASLEDELRASSKNEPDSPSLGSLRAQRDALEARYGALAARFASAQANAAEDNSLGQAIVVDRAIRAEPNIIGPPLLISLAVLVVFVLAFGSAYLAEMLNPRLISPIDVESLYGRPTLGTLSYR